MSTIPLSSCRGGYLQSCDTTDCYVFGIFAPRRLWAIGFRVSPASNAACTLFQAGERKPTIPSIILSIFSLCTILTHTCIHAFFAPDTLHLTPSIHQGPLDTATVGPGHHTASVLSCVSCLCDYLLTISQARSQSELSQHLDQNGARTSPNTPAHIQ